MSPADKSLGALRSFLEAAFTPSQLEQFLKENGFREVANGVAPNAPATRYCHEVVEELNRQSRLGADLFDGLKLVRGERGPTIDAIRAEFVAGDRPAEGLPLTRVQVEELLDTAGRAGLADYDTQMTLLRQVDTNLPARIGLQDGTSALLRASLDRLNRESGTGASTPLARWLALVIPLAEKRGHSGPYRRALEVLCGAEYRSAEDLDADSARPERSDAAAQFLTTDFLADGLQAAAAVCRVKVFLYKDGRPEQFADGRPVFVLGTGWLVSPSLVMTAWHTVHGRARTIGHRPAADELVNARLQAAAAEYAFDLEERVTSGVVFRGGRLLAWDADADLALIRLEGDTFRRGLRLGEGDGPLPADARVSTVHYPFAGRKRLSLRGRHFPPERVREHLAGMNAFIPAHLPADLWLLCDLASARGSSGAAIFDDRWRVVGQHIGFLQLPPSEAFPRRLALGSRLTTLRRFLTGAGATADDEPLFRAALDELAADRTTT